METLKESAGLQFKLKDDVYLYICIRFMKMLLKVRWLYIRSFHYEFWPYWLFYLPMYFYGIYLAIRAWTPTYFTAANPGMEYGGAFKMSKFEILQGIDDKYLPGGIMLPDEERRNLQIERLEEGGLEFPLIAKPDVGERGKGVEMINSFDELQEYLQKNSGRIILQEYIDLPLELGILYYRFPDGSRKEITSVVIRDFLSVEGDGETNLRDLLNKEFRARKRKKYLEVKFENRLDEIPVRGETIILEPIGNHSRGTRFLNGNHLINKELLKTITTIAETVPGFDYGRFDVKAESLDALYSGKNLKILELNGVSSEPGHIYDPGFRLINAYRAIGKHMHIIFKISRMNHESGVPYAPFLRFLKDLIFHIQRD